MTIRGLIQDTNRYGKFSTKEIIYLVITALVFAFVFSFSQNDKLGYDGKEDTSFNTSVFVYELVLYFVISAGALLALNVGYRFAAVHFGYEPSYHLWISGLVLNALFGIITGGWFLSPGGFDIKRVEHLQIGKSKIGIVMREKAYSAFFALFALVIYIILIKILPIPIEIRKEGVMIAFIIGLYTLLPIDILSRLVNKETPNSLGTMLIFGPRPFIAFTLVFFIIASLGVLMLPAIWGLLIAIVLAIISYLIFVLFVGKNKVWKL